MLFDWNRRRYSELQLWRWFLNGFGAAVLVIFIAMCASEDRERLLHPQGWIAFVLVLLVAVLSAQGFVWYAEWRTGGPDDEE